MSDRVRASELLGKSDGLFIDRLDVRGEVKILVVDPYVEGADD